MLILSPLFAAATAALLLVVHLALRIASPVWKLPGPLLSNFTSLILKWHELKANRTLYIHALHQKYGPVVRIAPNEVSFTSPAALKEIYGSGGSGYDKTEFYNLFQVFGRRTMFSTLDKTPHAKRKRMIGDRYANSNVMKSQSMTGIQERSKRFVQRCINAADSTPDIFRGCLKLTRIALHAYACDCVTHHLFHPYGSNCLQKQEDEDMMHEVAADDSLQNRLVLHYSPVLHRLMSKLLAFFAKPRQTPLADNYVLGTAKQGGTADFTLLSRLEEKGTVLDTVDMAAECLDHMAAGIDTTGDALCFLMWELSQPRSLHFQRRLQEEIHKGRDSSLDELPFLDAIVNEGLRCFPAIPMSLPRRVPQGGRTIDGYSLPEYTIVSCQAFSIHRINDDVFPEPDNFNPDRWLEIGGDADRKRLLFAFSSGGRGCVGKHLALAEMKTLLRDVYSQYRTEPEASMKTESMAMSDQLISSRPLGQRCLLKFVPSEADLIAEKETH
ncbi:Fc.00g076250.m01.CDS01 [Cosmosporella sp. VM-42]